MNWEVLRKLEENTKTRLRVAKSAEEVRHALDIMTEPGTIGTGESFWQGDGDTLLECLHEAGWRTKRIAASYYWVLTNDAGEHVAYTEGDVDYSDNESCAA